MSPRIIHILEAFAKAYRETGKEQPIMVIARYIYIYIHYISSYTIYIYNKIKEKKKLD